MTNHALPWSLSPHSAVEVLDAAGNGVAVFADAQRAELVVSWSRPAGHLRIVEGPHASLADLYADHKALLKECEEHRLTIEALQDDLTRLREAKD